VSIAETLSTFTISLKGLPDGCGDFERVSIFLNNLILIIWFIFIIFI